MLHLLLDRAGLDAERVRDVAVRAAVGDEREHLAAPAVLGGKGTGQIHLVR
ncbi:hypothetical protein GCM10025783_25280 [Amnibacterium soli]|uniref:Uncharacterized protein n=1 Tax=Amnibacterium soli TaxID=1282736 RepID=A0ABP8ZC16_9MICO